MEEISKMQQKRSLGKRRKQGSQGESTHETGSRCHCRFEKGRAISKDWMGSLRVKVSPWLTARKKMRISVLHLPRPESCQKPECSWKHFSSQILKNEMQPSPQLDFSLVETRANKQAESYCAETLSPCK